MDAICPFVYLHFYPESPYNWMIFVFDALKDESLPVVSTPNYYYVGE